MKCYVYGSNLTGSITEVGSGIIGFFIPDIGVVYRERFVGNRYECEYESLLALLDFIESNSETIPRNRIEILTDSAVVVYQLNGKMPVNDKLLPRFRRAERLKDKLKFNISWTPTSLNRAASTLPELPTIKAKFNFDFASRKKEKSRERLADDSSSLTRW